MMSSYIVAIVAILVVSMLVYLGYTELQRMEEKPHAKTAAVPAHTATAATATATSTHAKKSEPVDDAFGELTDVPPSMMRVAPPSNVDESVFLKDFTEDQGFRPVNKEAALKSANVRMAAEAVNGRLDGPLTRNVGLNPMMHARRSIMPEKTGASISFLDTDMRAHGV